MKKSLILSIVLFLFINITQIVFASAKTLFKTNEQYDICLEKNNNYNQKIKCAKTASNNYNKEINQTLLSLKKILTQSQYEELILSQKAWQDYKDKNNAILEKLLEDDSKEELKYASYRIKCDMLKKRAHDLIRLDYDLYFEKD